MKPNVGGLDRTLRIIAGIVLIVIGLFLIKSVGWMMVSIALGAVLLLTGLFRFCAMYQVCGRDTCVVKAAK
jgi:uncharacterized membrane protein HdeD (DUF308 family)